MPYDIYKGGLTLRKKADKGREEVKETQDSMPGNHCASFIPGNTANLLIYPDNNEDTGYLSLPIRPRSALDDAPPFNIQPDSPITEDH